MTEPKRKALVAPEFRRAVYRALLRTLPMVPGPELFDILAAARGSRESMDAKIDEALAALKSASTLIDDLESSLEDRTAKLTQLKQEVERYSKLADVEEDKAKALLAQLDLTLRKGRGRERWISLAINLTAGILIFLLGIVLSPTLTEWWRAGSNEPATPAVAVPSGPP